MDLMYKPDWEKTKERYRAWWAHEIIDRCTISVMAPKAFAPSDSCPAFPAKVEDRWLDFDYLKAINEYRHSHTFYGGEAFPIWNAGYPGWDMLQTYLGCPIQLAEETGWNSPIISTGELTDHPFRELEIRRENRWWQFSRKVHHFAVKQAAGKSVPGIQDLGGSGDILAAMRGTGQLLTDLLECADYVREFDQYLMEKWMEAYETFHKITKPGAEGSACWIGLWSPGRYFPVQNDLSYMISPKMFEEVFLPSIEMQVNFLDHSIYHVDGVSAFAHVDALCSLPGLDALQILPGEDKPSPLHYMDVLKKVQASGKNLHISIAADEVGIALEELSARGLFIETRCDTENEARHLLKMAEKWTKTR